MYTKGPTAQILMESAKKLGYLWTKLNKFIFQELCAPGHFPYDSQWNATRYVQEAIESGAVLVNHANVAKVITDGRRAVGVEYSVGKETRIAYASDIVLSAGGVGSAQILQRSGMNEAGDGFSAIR